MSVASMLLPLALLVSTAPAAITAPAEVVATPVTIHSGAVELPGTVIAPAGSGDLRPGVVIVHDAGPRSRADYEPEARALAEAGITTLIYDKRTTGYSLTNRSFPTLADDALAAIEVLQGWPGVDPLRVGLLGRSEGGWVAPLAATRSREVAFVVTVGASGLSPARTQAWSNVTYLADAGVRPPLRRPLGVQFTRVLVAAGMFGAADYDPVPTLEQVRQPILAVFGDRDRSTAPEESVRIFRAALERGGNESYTIKVVAEADHELRHSPTGSTPTDEFAPGYLSLVTSWITSLAEAPPTVSSDPAPRQEVQSTPLSPLAWYESLPMQLGSLLAMLVAFLTYPVVRLVPRVRGRRGDSPGRRLAATLAVLGPVTVIGSVGYVGYLTATGALAIGPVLAGRPVPWLLLQLLAVAVIAVAVATTVSWWRHRRSSDNRAGVGATLIAAGAFLPWALYWGLLTI